MTRLLPADVYRREADRLYSMADAFMYYDVRDEFLTVARHFEALAARAETQPDQLAGTQFSSHTVEVPTSA